MTYSLTHLLTLNLKARDASASENTSGGSGLRLLAAANIPPARSLQLCQHEDRYDEFYDELIMIMLLTASLQLYNHQNNYGLWVKIWIQYHLNLSQLWLEAWNSPY